MKSLYFAYLQVSRERDRSRDRSRDKTTRDRSRDKSAEKKLSKEEKKRQRSGGEKEKEKEREKEREVTVERQDSSKKDKVTKKSSFYKKKTQNIFGQVMFHFGISIEHSL